MKWLLLSANIFQINHFFLKTDCWFSVYFFVLHFYVILNNTYGSEEDHGPVPEPSPQKIKESYESEEDPVTETPQKKIKETLGSKENHDQEDNDPEDNDPEDNDPEDNDPVTVTSPKEVKKTYESVEDKEEDKQEAGWKGKKGSKVKVGGNKVDDYIPGVQR